MLHVSDVTTAMLVYKDDSFFCEKNKRLLEGAPQENDAKFRFAIHSQGIQQFHDK